MSIMEASLISMSPLLLRNLITSLFIFADKCLAFFSQNSKVFEGLRYVILSSFLFFLRILPSFFPSLDPPEDKYKNGDRYVPATVGGGGGGGGATGCTGDSGIARALSQLLSIVNDIPVSSRKYEVVRSLAERIIDENLSENDDALREVNRTVLSAAFARTLSQLEAAMLDQGRGLGSFASVRNGEPMNGTAEVQYYFLLSRLRRAVKYCSDRVWLRGRSSDELNRSASSAEKLAAELLWLAQKMAACESIEEAASRWASASNLAWLSLATEPRLQGFIVKISAFLFRQAKDMGTKKDDETKKEQDTQTKLKMLLLWIPLLCQASMGTDAPVLSIKERAELEKVLEDVIEALGNQEDQEKVLSLWLHHFTYCPSSDWPNLRDCYTRWCIASRRQLLRSNSYNCCI
ncbi:uncharacterized protein [Coffea arabica]|nr:uncharacterized protein LOC113726640 [Coffea arabica]